MENENQGINPVQNVATTSPVVDPLAPIDPLAPAQAPVVDPNATAPEENDNKKKLLLIIIIAAVILAIILALCLLKKDNITEAEKTITYADDVIKIGVTRDQGAYSYIGINGDDLYAQPLKYKIVVYDDIEKLVEDIDSGEIKIASVPAYQAANLYNQKHSVKAFSISQENNFSIVYNENIRSENNDGTLDSTVYEATTAPYASQVPEVQIDTRTSDEKQADAIDAMSDEEKELLEKALKYYDETPEVKELKKYTEELEKEMAEETGSNNIPEPPTYEDTTDSDTDIEESSDSNNDSTIYAFDKNKANGQKICVAGEGTASEFALAKYNQFEGVSSDVEWVKTPAECVKKIKNNEIN
ncbi:MAG: hypothetical protein LBN03_02535, partial [Bifidobacteriaceae bacterium]|nr:hypothetical protein [Bifidobacteriaceae bacterium]